MSVLSTTWNQREQTKWIHVFEETVRWVSPVGMYPRQTTSRTELLGLPVEEGARIGVIVASGNRDERVFDDPDAFNIARPRKPNLAFGGGAHYCMGVWAARTLVGEIAAAVVQTAQRPRAVKQGANQMDRLGVPRADQSARSMARTVMLC
jgi:cytochrome P450